MANATSVMVIDINKICEGSHVGTIRVTGMRRFNLRMRLVMLLLRLARWTAPVGFDIEEHRS